MNNIILIGMPGCGKSTVGVLLAKMAGLKFIDSDLLIQEREGKRLFEIINEKGNEEFLKIENEVNLAIDVSDTVIATGGSAVYCECAMEHLGRIGTVVYIKVPFCEIEKRIKNFSTRGIIIKSGSTLSDLYAERAPLYEKYADVTVECESGDLAENARKIMAALSREGVSEPA